MVISVFGPGSSSSRAWTRRRTPRRRRRGRGDGDPAGQPRPIIDRNGVPLAESVAGLMIVADPTRTATHAGRSPRSWPTGWTSTTSTCSASCASRTRQFVYVARRVPSHAGHRRSSPRSTSRGFKGVDTRRDPVRDLPGRRRRRQPDRLHERRRRRRRGAELTFDKLLAGKDGSETYEVGGGNRIPLGDNSTVAAVDGKDLTPDHRPRRAVVHPARAAHSRAGRRRRRPARPSSWTPAPARSSRWPTTRRTTPTSRACRPRTTSAPAR